MIPTNKHRATRAFTLIEVLVSVGIFAIVLSAISAVFFSALKLRSKSTELVDNALPAEHALAILRKDLANIVPPGGKFFGQLQTTQSSTNATSQVSGGLPMNTLPGQSSPQFYTTTGVVDEYSTFGEVQQVSYQLVASTNGGIGRDLFRTATRNLLPVTQTDADQESILSGVESIFFSFNDGTTWKDTWDSTTETLKLPRAIRVQIAMATEQRGGRLNPPAIQMVVPLIDAGTNVVATTTQ
jgi:type II secretion system protein J